MRVRNSLCDPSLKSRSRGSNHPTGSTFVDLWATHMARIFQLEPRHSSRCAAVGNHTRCSLFAPSCLTFCSSTWKWVNHADRPPATEQRLSAVFLDHEMDPSTSTSRWLSSSLRRLLGCLGLLQLWLISFNLFNIYICTGWHLIKLIIMHVCSRDRDYPL